jgi:hypothetical protein
MRGDLVRPANALADRLIGADEVVMAAAHAPSGAAESAASKVRRWEEGFNL